MSNPLQTSRKEIRLWGREGHQKVSGIDSQEENIKEVGGRDQVFFDTGKRNPEII